MRRTVLAFVTAAALALAFPSARLAGQGTDVLRINMDHVAPGAQVQAETGGSAVPHTTDRGTAGQNGALQLALDLGSLGKLDATFDAQFDVYVGQCPDQNVRVYMMQHGVEPPPECNRKMIGAFWWHKTHQVAVHYPNTLDAGGGMSTGMKVGIGAAAVGGVALALTHGSSGTTSPPTAATTPSTSTGTSTFNPMAYNGSFRGTMALQSDSKTCAGSTQSYDEKATISVNSSGAGTLILSDTPGFDRTYQIIITQTLTFTSTTTTPYFGGQIPGSLTATLTSTSLTITEASTFGACTNTERGTLAKQ